MSADNRKVSTDALETLGTIIGPNEKRDAIHLAVYPIQAGHRLYPGQHVGITSDGKAHTGANPLIGIVDPFLSHGLMPGDCFWLVIYPRVITSLRHVWTHPAFTDEPGVPAQTPVGASFSEQWIEGYAKRLGLTPFALLDGARKWVEYGWYLCGGSNLNGVYTSEEFWLHYEILTGSKVREKLRTNFFSCSC